MASKVRKARYSTRGKPYVVTVAAQPLKFTRRDKMRNRK